MKDLENKFPSRLVLYSRYQRIKKDCCEEWDEKTNFYKWYSKQFKLQKGLCYYCKLEGDTAKTYGRHFREGKRGKYLEIDRKNNNKRYEPENCVLACYPCNNAKSDVFSTKEFKEIGETINKLKSKDNQKSPPHQFQ